MTTFKQPMNSFKSYSDEGQSRDFEKISEFLVAKTAFDNILWKKLLNISVMYKAHQRKKKKL